MACIRYKKLLSAYLDGELKPQQRLQVKTHLQACSGCRQYHRQIEQTRDMVRDLEPMEAPAYSIPQEQAAAFPVIQGEGATFSIRRAQAGADRPGMAARWERIRGHSLAQPKPSLRPLAFAAIALVLVVAVMLGMDSLIDNGLEPNTGEEIAQITPPPAAGDEERPDWLKREIARRVQRAREQESPSAAGEQTAAAPDGREAAIADLSDDTAERSVAAAGPEPAPRTQDPLPIERQHGEQQEEQIAQFVPAPGRSTPPARTTSLPTGRDENAGRDARGTSGSRPTHVGATIALLPAEVTTGQGQPGTETDVDTGAESTTRLAAQPPARTPAAPETTPVEIGAPVMTVAVLTESAEEALAFLDPDVLERKRQAGEPILLRLPDPESLQMEVADEIEVPAADRQTGIVPPVVLSRDPLTLEGRLAEVRSREQLATLLLQVLVGTDGNVVKAEPVTGTGLQWLDEALTEAVQGWTFRPAERDGEPLAASIEVVVEFDLD